VRVINDFIVVTSIVGNWKMLVKEELFGHDSEALLEILQVHVAEGHTIKYKKIINGVLGFEQCVTGFWCSVTYC